MVARWGGLRVAFFIAATIQIFLCPLTDTRQAQIVTELHDADQLATISSNEAATEIDPTTVRAMSSGPEMANPTNGRDPGTRTDRGPEGVPRGDPGLPRGEQQPRSPWRWSTGACPAASPAD